MRVNALLSLQFYRFRLKIIRAHFLATRKKCCHDGQTVENSCDLLQNVSKLRITFWNSNSFVYSHVKVIRTNEGHVTEFRVTRRQC